MIRTSRHTTKFSNKYKLAELENLVNDYQLITQFFVDYLWNNKITYKNKTFDIKNDLLDCPSMLSTKSFVFPGISQRLIKCAATQACGIVKSTTEKRRRLLWLKNKLQIENKSTTHVNKKLAVKLTKPVLKDIKCEINSICLDTQKGKSFDLFLCLKSLGEKYNKIKIPIKHHRQSKKHQQNSKQLNSILLTKNYVELRWEKQILLRKTGNVIGADQGMKTCLTLSDNQITKKNSHDYDLEKIQNILTRKKKGSKNFAKTQAHRKNYINWSINQLNWSGIKELRLEKIFNIGYKKRKSRKMSHWTNTLIRDKCMRLSEELGVQVVEQSCAYRSQRCSSCGLVCKSQRKGKLYSCNKCGYIGDADVNAAKNHEIDLPDVSGLRSLGINKSGFIWLKHGVFDLNGKELTVPNPKLLQKLLC